MPDSSPAGNNLDRLEIEKFSQMAHHWWTPNGALKALHHINPLRLSYIEKRVPLQGMRVLDVGCGGGILSEALAKSGALVTGLDAADATLEVARQHARTTNLRIDYQLGTIETFNAQNSEPYDVITCMELLEHVPDPAAILEACASLLSPEGYFFCATLNKTLKAFLLAIVGAEYILGIVPRGTHQIGRFIKPVQLKSWARNCRLECQDLSGYTYNPFNGKSRLTSDTAINYMACFTKGVSP